MAGPFRSGETQPKIVLRTMTSDVTMRLLGYLHLYATTQATGAKRSSAPGHQMTAMSYRFVVEVMGLEPTKPLDCQFRKVGFMGSH
jgi:hypothetical protein